MNFLYNRKKRVISRSILVGITILISISLYACNNNSNQIKVDVNSPEVQATLGKVRNYEAEKLLPSGTAEREKTVWIKRNHNYAEPPEEDKIYSKYDGTSWFSPYVYNGEEYWVNGSNEGKGARRILKKTGDNYRNDIKNTVMVISHKVNDSIYKLIAEYETGREVSKNLRGSSSTINITR